MIKLLRFEFHRLFRQKSFYVCTLVMLALLFLYCLIGWLSAKEDGIAMYTQESAVWGAMNMSSYLTVLAIFIPILVCEDYEQQTIKNIVARGYGSRKIYIAKLITVLTAGVLMLAFLDAAGAGFGQIFFEPEDMNRRLLLKTLLGQFVLAVSYMTLYYAISNSLRKTGGAIALSIFLPIVVSLLLTLLTSSVKIENEDLSQYWIESFSGMLRPDMDGETVKRCLIGSAVYTVFFIVTGHLEGSRKDHHGR